MDITVVWLIDTGVPPPAGLRCVLYVSHTRFSPFSNSYYWFKILFLRKQTRHGNNTVTFYSFLFICGRAKCLSREQCVAALCSSWSLQTYLERWPRAWNEAGRSVLMSMKGPKIPRTELNTVHLHQYYSLLMHNKL